MEISKVTNGPNVANIASIAEKLVAAPQLQSVLEKNGNLKVTNLDKLVGHLNIETSDTREDIQKSTLESFFTTVIAIAEEARCVSDSNMAQLNAAKQYSDELAVVDSQLKDLMNQATEIDNGIETKKKRVKKFQQDLEQLQKDLTAEGADTDKIKKEIAKVQLEMATVNAEITTLQTQLSGVKASIASLNATKSNIEAKINEAISNIKDLGLLKAIADSLKIDIRDIHNDEEYPKAERSKEEEKWLDEHSPVRIIQDAINRHNDELLDDISKSKEDKI